MKIGLALSGGGALGSAHVGVLEELDKHGVPIELVCGASAGALIGLLYVEGGIAAVNGFLQDYDNLRITSKVRGFLTNPPSRLFGEMRTLMSKYVTAKDISELHPRYLCIATDIADGEMMVFDHGDPIDCVLASSAYPGLFPSQRIGDRYYIDGGVTRNMPADIVRHNGMDFVIGSSLYSVPKVRQSANRLPFNRLNTLLRSIEIMERALSSLQMTYCDFCFVPPTGSYKWYDFDQVSSITAIGRKYASEKIGELMHMLDNTFPKIEPAKREPK